MRAILTVTVAGREPEHRRLPEAEVSVGRGMGWGLRAADSWCSRSLLDLEPTERGWLAYNHHDGLEVMGPRIVEARFRSGAFVLLTRGTWSLSWSARLTLGVDVATSLTAEQRALPIAPEAFDPDLFEGTDPLTLALRPEDKHRVAVLFRHLLERTEPPANLARAAAADLDLGEAVLRAYANTLRRRVSEVAHVPLPIVEDLGEYLIRRQGLVTRAHLRPR